MAGGLPSIVTGRIASRPAWLLSDTKLLALGSGLTLLLLLSPLVKKVAGSDNDLLRAGDLSCALCPGAAFKSDKYSARNGSQYAFTLGYDRLLADCFWLAFVSYAGDSRARSLDKYCLADRYLDTVTRLDPHFIQAYWFSAFTVGADEAKPERAAKIIDRGIAANPFDWSLPFIGGINQYLYAGNDRLAARYYRMAARFPGAPPWLSRQAAILERGIPAVYKQISLWENIYNSQESPLIKEKARETLASLWLSLYKSAPTDGLRERAASALRALDPGP